MHKCQPINLWVFNWHQLWGSSLTWIELLEIHWAFKSYWYRNLGGLFLDDLELGLQNFEIRVSMRMKCLKLIDLGL
jgi:hypothetical protein